MPAVALVAVPASFRSRFAIGPQAVPPPPGTIR